MYDELDSIHGCRLLLEKGVLAGEQLADRFAFEHALDGVGEDARHGQDLDLGVGHGSARPAGCR